MPHSLEAAAQSLPYDCPKTWRTFFQVHGNALFQTALLLAADPYQAEVSVAAALETLDLSQPPAESQFVRLQETLVAQTLQNGQASGTPKISEARNLLQAGLQPILQMERFPRVCFVLRTLLGYATSACAQTLGIEEAAVRTMLQIAILQLQNAVAGTSSRAERPADSLNLDGWGEYPVAQSSMDPAAAHC